MPSKPTKKPASKKPAAAGKKKGRVENLKPFRKGQSGNPKGREPGSMNRATLLKKWLEKPGQFHNPVTDPEKEGKKQKLTPQDVATLAIIRKAMNGSLEHFQEIQNTLFGKLPDKVELDKTINSGAEVVIQLPHNGREPIPGEAE